MAKLHLKKVAAGISSLEELKTVHERRAAFLRAEEGALMSYSYTRTRPIRHEELLVEGSLYWVLQKQMVARQELLGFDSWVHSDGKPCWRINLSPEVVDLIPIQHNYFQGWRYLELSNCPEDLETSEDSAKLPVEMRLELKKVGLL